jgi:hypothetical protein
MASASHSRISQIPLNPPLQKGEVVPLCQSGIRGNLAAVLRLPDCFLKAHQKGEVVPPFVKGGLGGILRAILRFLIIPSKLISLRHG